MRNEISEKNRRQRWQLWQERLTPAQSTTPNGGSTQNSLCSSPPLPLSLGRELIKNSKYVSNLICAFVSLCVCTCVCVCKAPLIAGQGVRKGCSHLIFPLWSLNMYKPEVGYVSVPTPHKPASVCNCACVCNISTKNSRPVLFYQHLGIVARHRARPQRELRPLQRLTLHTK